MLKTTQHLEINPNAKEAILFALLANEAVSSSQIDFGGRAGVPNITMGKISLPR